MSKVIHLFTRDDLQNQHPFLSNVEANKKQTFPKHYPLATQP